MEKLGKIRKNNNKNVIKKVNKWHQLMIQNHFFLSGFGDCSRGFDNGSNSTAVSDGNAGGTGSCSLRSARLCNDVETI